MKKSMLGLASLFFLGSFSANSADHTPFYYGYKIDGYIAGVTSAAFASDANTAICYIAIDKPDLKESSPGYVHYRFYHYSMSAEACGTAKLAFMAGEPVYFWGIARGKDKNPEAVAVEVVRDNVKWQIAPKAI